MRKVMLISLAGFIVLPFFPQETQIIPKDKGYVFSKNWKDQRSPLWAEILTGLKGRANINYLEVGVFEGGSFFWMLDNIFTDESNKAFAVDIFQGHYYETFLRNLEKSGHGQKVTVRKAFSQDALREMPANFFNVIYVDGDHRAPAVLSDAVMSWGLLRDGGFLIFDDYWLHPEIPEDLRPKVAIDSFLTAYRNELEIIHKGGQVICRKRESRYPKNAAYHTVFGDYFYVWSVYVYMPEHGLFDKNAQKMPLSPEEESMVQSIIKNRGFGQVDIKVGSEWLEHERFIQLRDKLKLEIIDGVIVKPHPDTQ